MKKKFRPLISIIIPVYNGSNYVREAIDSAINQTYDNVEIIVINDGSTDNTEAIAKSYGNKIRYFKKVNGGVASALNLAIKKSKGQYISWLSHDDVYNLEKIDKQIHMLANLDQQDRLNMILMSNYAIINEKSKHIVDQQFQKNHDPAKLDNQLYPLLNGLVHGCTLLIPKHCFNEVRYFNEKLKATQDYDLWFEMFPRYKTKFMTDILVKSRVHDQQSTKKISTVKEECDHLWIKMVKDLTDKQKIELSGTITKFYKKTLELTNNAGYLGASAYISEQIEKRNRKISEIKVSVIIPFFNRINWTIEAIQSVLNQTHKKIEIILIDDASTEDIERIKKIIIRDKRIIYIRNNKNFGVAKSRNIGIEKSTGEYIAFLDSDDLFTSNKIKKQLSYLVKNAEDFCHTSYVLVDEKGKTLKKVESGISNTTYPKIIENCQIATPTVMVKKEIFFEKNIRFPENFQIGEDICLWILISKVCSLKGNSEFLSMVRNHGHNAAFDIEKQIQGQKNIYDFIYNYSLDVHSLLSLNTINETMINLLIKKFGVTDLFRLESNIIRRNISLDKVYMFPIIGHLIVRIYLRIKKMLGTYEE